MSSGSTKRRILEEAHGLLEEVGAGKFSLRETARRVGITPMAVYRHFADKEALLEALCGLGFEQLRDVLQGALESDDPAERLRQTFYGYLRFATDAPNTYALVFERRMRPGERAGRSTVPAFRFVVDRVAEAMAGGVLPAGDTEAVALDLWAVTHGLVTLRRAGKLELSEAEFDAHFEGMVRRQIGAPAKP
ncbi:MAG: TetR/AcrR family transcriptional regulator [Proteobacteria bacterium]|nr:TetR/AcrR family transcriptional regulator [Pseudomonadota bacterium]